MRGAALRWLTLLALAGYAAAQSCPSFMGFFISASSPGNITVPFFQDPYSADSNQFYGPNENCTWTITAPTGFYVQFNMLRYHFFMGDGVSVYDGRNASSPLLAQFWGDRPSVVPDWYFATGRFLTVRFTSGNISMTNDYQYLGFAMVMNAVTAADVPTYCAPNTVLNLNAYNMTSYFFPMMPNGDYVNAPYRAGLNCTWVVRAPPGWLVSTTLQISQPLMLGDYLEVRDGASGNGPLILRYASFVSSYTYNVTSMNRSNALTVRFISTARPKNTFVTVSIGFTTLPANLPSTGAAYRTVNDASGTLRTPEIGANTGAYPYMNRMQNCSWLVGFNTTGSYVVLSSISGSVSKGDYVRVYDGPNSSSPLMYNFVAAFDTSVAFSQALASTRNYLFVVVHVVAANPYLSNFVQISFYQSPLPTYCPANTIVTIPVSDFSNITEPTPFIGSSAQYLYPNRTCRWNITAPAGYIVSVQVSQVNPIQYESQIAQYDTLSYYYQPPSGPKVLLQTNQGYLDTYYAKNSPGNNMLIELTTAPVGQSRANGFVIIASQIPYTPCALNTVYNVSDTNTIDIATNNPLYAPNRVCVWRFQNVTWSSLTITSLYLGADDYLEIWNGTIGVGGKLLANFSVTETEYVDSGQTELVQSRSPLIMRFVSGPFKENDGVGFSATFQGAQTYTPAPQRTCQGTINVPDARVGGYFGNALPFNDSSFDYQRNSYCKWIITAPAGFLPNFTLPGICNMAGDISIEIYDGTAPFWSCNGGGCCFSQVALTAWTQTMTIIYHTGDVVNYGANPGGFSGQYGATPILPTWSKCPNVGGIIKGAATWTVATSSPSGYYAPGTNCIWNADAGVGNMWTIHLEYHGMAPGVFFRVFDGPNMNAPLALDMNYINYNIPSQYYSSTSGHDYLRMRGKVQYQTIFTTQRNITMQFYTPPDVQVEPGYLVNMKPTLAPIPCVGLQTINVPGGFSMVTELSAWKQRANGAYALPANYTCAWDLVAPAGSQAVIDLSTLMWGRIHIPPPNGGYASNPIQPFEGDTVAYDMLSIYDAGTGRLLTNLSRDDLVPRSPNLPMVSTNGTLRVVYNSGPYPTGGFQVRYGAMQPPAPCPASPIVIYLPMYTGYDVFLPRDIFDPTYAPAFPTPAGTTCTYLLVGPVGSQITMQIAQDYNNAVPLYDVFVYEGNTTNPAAMINSYADNAVTQCHVATLQIVSRGLGATAVRLTASSTGGIIDAHQWSALPQCAALLLEKTFLFCPMRNDDQSIYAQATVDKYANCSLIFSGGMYIYVNDFTNITFPNLRQFPSQIYISNYGFDRIIAPKLEYMQSYYSYQYYGGQPASQGWNIMPSLKFSYQIQIYSSPILDVLSLPELSAVSVFYIDSSMISGIDLPKLTRVAYQFFSLNNHDMRFVNLPSLYEMTPYAYIWINESSSLSSVNLNSLTAFECGYFGIGNAPMLTQFNLPSLINSRRLRFGISGTRSLNTFTMARVTRLYSFILNCNMNSLTALSLPTLTLCDGIDLSDVALTYLNLPALSTMNSFNLKSMLYLQSVTLPLWDTTAMFYYMNPGSVIQLSNTAIQWINLPSYSIPVSVYLANNPMLQYIGMCNVLNQMTLGSNYYQVRLVNNSALPCSGVNGLFAQFIAANPTNNYIRTLYAADGCDASFTGVFGCSPPPLINTGNNNNGGGGTGNNNGGGTGNNGGNNGGGNNGGNNNNPVIPVTPPDTPTVPDTPATEPNVTCGFLTSCIQKEINTNVGGYANPIALQAGVYVWDVPLNFKGLVIYIVGVPGGQTILQAPYAGSLALVTASSSVTFVNIIFQGTTGVDSMVQVSDATVAFLNCTLRDHTFPPLAGRGAAVVAMGAGTVSFFGCLVTNNTADDAGAVYAANAGVYVAAGSVFSYNVARAGAGGALQLAPTSANGAVTIGAVLSDSVFMYNYAATTGGAVDSQVSLTALRVTARLNVGVSGGGAFNLATLGSSGTTSLATFINGWCEGNVGASGGAVAALKMDVFINGTVFANNSATESNGGALSVSDCALELPAGQSLAARTFDFSLTVANAVLLGNVALNAGGGVFTDGVSVQVGAITAQSNAGASGAVFYFRNGNVQFGAATNLPYVTGTLDFTSNYAENGVVFAESTVLVSQGNAMTFAYNLGSSLQGTGSQMTVGNLNSHDNVAIAGAGLSGQTTQFNVAGGTFSNNKATVADYKSTRASLVGALLARVQSVRATLVTAFAPASNGGYLTIPAAAGFSPATLYAAIVSYLQGILTANDLLATRGLGTSSNFVIGRGAGVFVDDAMYLNISGSSFTNGLADVGGVFFLGSSRSGSINGASTQSMHDVTPDDANFYAILRGDATRHTDTSALHPRDLSQLINANTLSGNAATLYGPIGASQPVGVSWVVAPLTEVRPGQYLASTGTDLSAKVVDYFGQTVTTGDPNVLQLQIGGGLAVSGQVAVLADPTGTVTFSGVYLLTSSIDDVEQSYNLTVGNVLFPNAASLWTVYVAGCQAGSELRDNSSCQACAAGSYSADGSVCIPCSAGSFASQPGQTACLLCPAETYGPQPGLVQCVTCLHAQPGQADCATLGEIVTPPPSTFVQVGVPIIAVVIGLLLLALLGIYITYRCTARKTMAKYYLADDSTIRADGDTTLQKEVKKMILANTTRRIGGGLFADIFKAKYNNEFIVLKVLRGDSNGFERAQKEFRREAVALGKLLDYHHPAIIEMQFFLDRGPMCVGLAFATNGTVKKLLETRRLLLHEKVKLLAEAASAMSLVHAKDIVHLDLKTDNLLLDDDFRVKLADFGISRQVGEDAYSTQDTTFRDSMMSVGPGGMACMASIGPGGMELQTAVDPEEDAFTPQYVDPIRLIRKVRDPDGLRQADVFSFGTVMWAVYAQVEPYAGEEPRALLERLKADTTLRPAPIPGCHICLDSLMHKCWNEKPEMRPAFPDIYANLTKCLSEHHGNELDAAYANFGTMRNNTNSTNGSMRRGFAASSSGAAPMNPVFASSMSPNQGPYSQNPFMPAGGTTPATLAEGGIQPQFATYSSTSGMDYGTVRSTMNTMN